MRPSAVSMFRRIQPQIELAHALEERNPRARVVVIGFKVIVEQGIGHQSRVRHPAAQEALEEPISGEQPPDQLGAQQAHVERGGSGIERRIHEDQLVYFARVAQGVECDDRRADAVPDQDRVIKVEISEKLAELAHVGVEAIGLVLRLL